MPASLAPPEALPPPAASLALPAEAPAAGGPERAALPMAEERGEPALTGRELLEYALMLGAGLLITSVTVWLYWLIQ